MRCTHPAHCVRAVLVLALVLFLTGGVASAAWWIDTPSGYQKIGGKARIGPYKTYYDAQNVNNAKFNGAGYVSGYDDKIADDGGGGGAWRGYAVVQIVNKTSHTVNYSIRKRSSQSWSRRTIACGHNYMDWIDVPAQFQIEFDHSAARGYQRKSYNLDYNVSRLKTPTGSQARKYQFVQVSGGIDLRTFSSAPYARCAGSAPKVDPRATRAAEKARMERSRLSRLARAERLVDQINRVRNQHKELGRSIPRLQDEIVEHRITRANMQLRMRLLGEEDAAIKRTTAAWSKAHEQLEGRAADGPARHAALLKLASEVAALREAAGIKAASASTAFRPPPKVELGRYEPDIETDARYLREKSPPPVVRHAFQRINLEPPSRGPYASDAYLQGLQSRLAASQVALAKDRARERELTSRRDQLKPATWRHAADAAKIRARITTGHRGLHQVGHNVEKLLVDAYVDKAEQAITAEAAEWLAKKIPPPLRKQAKALSDDLKAQLGSVDHYLSTWKRLRAYAELMKQHTEPGGLLPALFRAMDPALQLPGNEAFAADAEQTLGGRFGAFATEIQDLGLPEEVQSWAGLYKKVFAAKED